MPGAAGYNLWNVPPANLAGETLLLGVDDNQMAFYFLHVTLGASVPGGIIRISETCKFSYSPPANIPPIAFPSPGVPLNFSGWPPASALPSGAWVCMDGLDRMWLMWGVGVAGVFTYHLQSYDLGTGSIVSDTDISGGGQQDIGHGGGTSFIAAGEYYLAIWRGRNYDSLVPAFQQATLDVYNITSGAPVNVGTITMPLDTANFNITYGHEVFFDGINSLWFFQYDLNIADGQPLGGTLHRVDFQSMAIVASAAYVGPYAFIGNPADGHIYLLNINGSVSDVDPFTLSIINTYPLGADLSLASNPGQGPSGVAFTNDEYPFANPVCTYMMNNPTFGISTDIGCGNQFFLQYPSVFGPTFGAAFTRVKNLTFVDTLALYTDWGLGGANFGGRVPMYMNFRHSIVSFGAIGQVHVSFGITTPVVVEFMYESCLPCNGALEFR